MIHHPSLNELHQDPNTNHDKLENAIHLSKEKCLPVKIVRLKKYKHKISPWMTNGILSSIKIKDKMYIKLKKMNPLSNNYSTLDNELKIYCKMLQKCVRLAKSSYYHTQFQRCKSNIKKTWSQINEIIQRKDKKSEFPKYFTENNNIITGDNEIAECFNNYFINVGPSLSRKINIPRGKSYKKYLTTKNSIFIYF